MTPLDEQWTWLRTAQRYDEAHNPAFPGYRRTLQPMPEPRRIPLPVLLTAISLVLIAAFIGACALVAAVSAAIP